MKPAKAARKKEGESRMSFKMKATPEIMETDRSLRT